MSKRTVYLTHSDLLEVRFIGEDDERTATDWRNRSRPTSMLLSFPDAHSIEYGDPQITATWYFAKERDATTSEKS